MSVSVCQEYSLHNEDTDEYFHEGDYITRIVYYKDNNECSVRNVYISNITQDTVTLYNSENFDEIDINIIDIIDCY